MLLPTQKNIAIGMWNVGGDTAQIAEYLSIHEAAVHEFLQTCPGYPRNCKLPQPMEAPGEQMTL